MRLWAVYLLKDNVLMVTEFLNWSSKILCHKHIKTQITHYTLSKPTSSRTFLNRIRTMPAMYSLASVNFADDTSPIIRRAIHCALAQEPRFRLLLFICFLLTIIHFPYYFHYIVVSWIVAHSINFGIYKFCWTDCCYVCNLANCFA